MMRKRQIRTGLSSPKSKEILHYKQPTIHEPAVPIVSAFHTCVYHTYLELTRGMIFFFDTCTIACAPHSKS